MRVVKVRSEAEEGDYGGEFVQDEERRDVCDGSVGQGIGVFVQEAREAPVEALDPGLRRGRRRCGVGAERVICRWSMCMRMRS